MSRLARLEHGSVEQEEEPVPGGEIKMTGQTYATQFGSQVCQAVALGSSCKILLQGRGEVAPGVPPPLPPLSTECSDARLELREEHRLLSWFRPTTPPKSWD